MVKVFIIIGLFLVIAGVPGLFWSSFQNGQQQQQIDICKAKYKHQVDEYVQKLTGSSLKATDANAIDAATATPNPEKMKPSERLQYQKERLLADIDELAEATIPIPPNADVVYGDNWRQKVADYKDKKQSRAAIQVGSATALLAGGVLFVAALIFAFFRVIAAGIRWGAKAVSGNGQRQQPGNSSRPIPQERIAPPVVAVVNSPAPAAKAPATTTAEEFRKMLAAQAESLKETNDQLKNLTNILQQRTAEHEQNLAKRLEKGFKSQHESFKHENDLLKKVTDDIRKTVESQSHNLSAAIMSKTGRSEEIIQAAQKQTAEAFNAGLDNIRRQIEELNTAVAASASRQPEPIDIPARLEKAFQQQTELLKGQIEPLKDKIAETEKFEKVTQTAHKATSQLFNEGFDVIRRQIEELNTAVAASASRQPEPIDISGQLEKAFNEQTELLKNQIEPLKNKPAAPITSDAVSKNLADLTEQVAAIREYAAKQQQRLAKLQDGYDWNIIKNFCLRVIRCIDNLDDRIGELSANGGLVDHLLPVREELVFILESNGIERFGAKIDSDYRGQENRMQVLNEREETEDTELIGRIANVVRPGYQCRVNDEYTKIVRPAQVRLYGSSCLSDVAVRGS